MGGAASRPVQVQKKGYPQADIPFLFSPPQKKNPAPAGFSFAADDV
jgi:hypothetical protein